MNAIKFFAVPVIIFLAMGYATLSHACGIDMPEPNPIAIDVDIRP